MLNCLPILTERCRKDLLKEVGYTDQRLFILRKVTTWFPLCSMNNLCTDYVGQLIRKIIKTANFVRKLENGERKR